MDQKTLEPLREVTTIAAGNAATALSKLIGHDVTVAVPSVKLVAVERVLQEVGHIANLSTATLVKVKGDIQGLLLITLDPKDAKTVTTDVATKLTGQLYDGEDQSVLHEIVNIVSGAALSAMAGFLKINILQSVPASTTDMLGAILDPFIAEFGREFETALILQELFTLSANGTSIKCIVIIDPPSTAKMLQKMNEKIDPKHAADD